MKMTRKRWQGDGQLLRSHSQVVRDMIGEERVFWQGGWREEGMKNAFAPP
jgi:hypothetical protein